MHINYRNAWIDMILQAITQRNNHVKVWVKIKIKMCKLKESSENISLEKIKDELLFFF